MVSCTSNNWRPLTLSLLLSMVLHIVVVAGLCAFPINSPARLSLTLGNVSFDVDLVALGEPSLGTGYTDSGDGPGDGHTLNALRITIVRSDDEDNERTTRDPLPSIRNSPIERLDDSSATEPTPASNPAERLLTDVAVSDHPLNITTSDTTDREVIELRASAHDPADIDTAKRAGSPTDRADGDSSDTHRVGVSASPERGAGTGQLAGAASTGGAVGVHSGVRFSGQRPPSYPIEAQRRGLEGEALLWLRVSADGRVLEAKLQQSSGHELLDGAALHWAESLHFVPARRSGAPISTEVLLPVRYRLRDVTR